MALPEIKLDDRNFQDIVNEVRRRIPDYCPEWTDHSLPLGVSLWKWTAPAASP